MCNENGNGVEALLTITPHKPISLIFQQYNYLKKIHSHTEEYTAFNQIQGAHCLLKKFADLILDNR